MIDVNGKKLVSIGYVRPAYTDNDLLPLGLAGGLQQLKDEFDAHYDEAAKQPMNFRYAMHNFTGGRPGLAKVFERFLAYAKDHSNVWFCRCIDIAEFWAAEQEKRLVRNAIAESRRSLCRTETASILVRRSLVIVSFLLPGYALAQNLSMEELNKRAVAEGGKLTFYGTLAQVNAEKVLPAFEKRFPGVKVDHIDATADKLIARAVTEARGGRTFVDVFQFNLRIWGKRKTRAWWLAGVPPEAAAYPANLKGPYYVATDIQFIVPAWNTKLVKKEEEPTQLEDFTQPRWKNRLMAEPRDVELLVALKHKLGSEEKAIAIVKQIAANNVEFHKGHSELAEFLVAGQGALCVTCYAHHYPSRMKKGAPVNFMLTEGIGSVVAVADGKKCASPQCCLALVSVDHR